ncbi:MAG: glycosyltransferase family 2 protein [Candidatus Saganbacteria bacterium]|nr:glycosyltransferase family 2 protein [Candidatus Saganbacteria bacterium]
MSVTIITPSFNKPRYVLDAIKSVISQTHQDWTYYIVDNSTDVATRNTIKDFLKKASDDRIKYLEVNFSDSLRERFHIPSVLCNALCLLADKKYIYYLSDDDMIHELCLESMVKFLEENFEFGACYCRGESIRFTVDSGQEKWIKVHEFPFGQTFNGTLLPDELVDGGQVLIKKSIIEKMFIASETINFFLMPKIKGASNHSDGIFLNKLTGYTEIHPCIYNSDKILLIHRNVVPKIINKRASFFGLLKN